VSKSFRAFTQACIEERTCRPLFFLAALCLAAASTTHAAADLQRFDFKGAGMATTFRISLYAEKRADAEAAADACFVRIARLNAIFTDYDPSSELMRLCAPDAKYPMAVSGELFDLLERARRLAELTNGAYDPTCGHLTQLWRRAKRQGKLPPADRLAKAIATTDWRRIQLEPAGRRVTLVPGTLIDLGGIAKGYAADECLRLLKERGFPCAIVLAGGDTAAGDPPPGQKGWEVKLRTFTKPGPDEDLETVLLANQAVSTSGDLYQFVELEGRRYSHIIDPKTGLGLTRRIACSVFAPDCTTSDALATAMCVLGKEKGESLAAVIPGVQVRFPDSAKP
jgi:thiamine biosynthesis lipoprotein